MSTNYGTEPHNFQKNTTLKFRDFVGFDIEYKLIVSCNQLKVLEDLMNYEYNLLDLKHQWDLLDQKIKTDLKKNFCFYHINFEYRELAFWETFSFSDKIVLTRINKKMESSLGLSLKLTERGIIDFECVLNCKNADTRCKIGFSKWEHDKLQSVFKALNVSLKYR